MLIQYVKVEVVGGTIRLLEVWHPDIIDFMKRKERPKLKYMNLSVGILKLLCKQ